MLTTPIEEVNPLEIEGNTEITASVGYNTNRGCNTYLRLDRVAVVLKFVELIQIPYRYQLQFGKPNFSIILENKKAVSLNRFKPKT